jgi:hypothetical protein
MNTLVLGQIRGRGSRGAPRPSGAGSTRHPDGSASRGGGLSADEFGAR